MIFEQKVLNYGNINFILYFNKIMVFLFNIRREFIVLILAGINSFLLSNPQKTT